MPTTIGTLDYKTLKFSDGALIRVGEPREVSDRQRIVRLTDWDAFDPTGVVDMSSIMNEAQQQASQYGYCVELPPGSIGINSPVDILVPTYGAGIRNTGTTGVFGTEIVNLGGINGGATDWDKAMLRMLVDTNDKTQKSFMYFEGFTLRGRDMDCIGLYSKAASTGGASFTRFRMQSIRAFGCLKGIDIEGFIGTIIDCHTLYNKEAGLTWALCNNSNIIGGEYNADYRDQPNSTAVVIKPRTDNTGRSHGITLSGVSIETDGVCNGLRICEKVSAVTLINTYFEGYQGNSTVDSYAISVGEYQADGSPATNLTENAVTNFTVIGGTFSSSSGNNIKVQNGGGLRLGNVVNVKGVNLNWVGRRIDISPNSFNVDIENAAYTKSATSGVFGSGVKVIKFYEDSWLSDSSNQTGHMPVSFFTNPTFKGGLRGYANSSIVSAAIASTEETTITRNGISSLKITQDYTKASSGEHGQYMGILNIGSVSPLVQGKWVTVGGYLYIPNAAPYSTMETYPTVGISWINAAVQTKGAAYYFGYNGSISNPGRRIFGTLGSWNRFILSVYVPVGEGNISEFCVYVKPHNAGSVISTNAIVYLSNLFCAVNAGNTSNFQQGIFSTNSIAGTMNGGMLEIPGTAPPTGTGRPWLKGDKIINTDLINDGCIGWVCMASGSPGTWKPYGLIGT